MNKPKPSHEAGDGVEESRDGTEDSNGEADCDGFS